MQKNSAVSKHNYSAEIDIWLECGDRTVPLSHACDIFVVAAQSVQLPPCDAVLVFTVDGTRYDRPVTLPEGLSPGIVRTPVRDRAPVSTTGSPA